MYSFEDELSDIQADMVSICLEYINNRAEKVYIHCMNDNGLINSNFFYKINGKVFERHKLNNDFNDIQPSYEDFLDLQIQVLRILCEDIQKLTDICKNYDRPMPSEMKLIYDVQKNKLSAQYSYDFEISEDPDAPTIDDFEEAWFNEIKAIEESEI